MLRLRMVMIALAALLVPGCVEQEPDRPTVEDKRQIKENILSSAPEMKFKVNADLEGKVTYLGLDVDRDVIKPGEQFKLTHYWKVNKKIDGWRLFVHLNAPDKKGFINADHRPVGGRYPVTRWKPGEIVRDEHTVTLPGGFKESKIMVFAGLWKGKLRMKVTGPKDAENRILCATLTVGGAAPPAPPAPAKRLVAIQTTTPVKVDGKLDDEIWSKAASSGAFVNTMSGAKVELETQAKVAWDDKFLYVAFSSKDPDVWTTLTKRDDKLWTQEVVEVFIDANADKKDYVELQVNPRGTIFDSYLPAYRKNQNDWNSKLKAAVQIDGTLNKREDTDKGWTVEMAIPWADTKGRGTYEMELPPKPGAVWRVNFFRFDHPKGKPPAASAWSPPRVGDFHVLDKFGELVFGDAEGKAPAPAPAATPATPEKKAAGPTNMIDPKVVRMAIPPKTVHNLQAKRLTMPVRLAPRPRQPGAKPAGKPAPKK